MFFFNRNECESIFLYNVIYIKKHAHDEDRTHDLPVISRTL
jgi:hypothetical protein